MQTTSPKIELSAEAEKARALEALKPSCSNCDHFLVCAIAKAFIPLISNSFPPDKEGKPTSPIDPLVLAQHCKKYVRAGSVITT